MKHTTVNNNWLNDFSTTGSHTIDLSAEEAQWAARACQMIENKQEQWQSFLDALAVVGINQWLNQGAQSFETNYDQTQLSHKGINLAVGNCSVCVIGMGAMSDTQVDIPISPVTEPMAHLYLLAEVREEVNQVVILAGLRREKLVKLNNVREADLSIQSLTIEREGFHSMPISAFNLEPEQVLFYLSCFDPAAIQPVSAPSFVNDVAGQIINAKLWLKDQLDQVTEELKWALLPPLIPSRSMRPIRTTVETVMARLSNEAVLFPPDARGASGPITIGADFICQIYTWVWPVESARQPEWSLFVLLAPELSDGLPTGIQLQVSDQNAVLETVKQLPGATDETYLYIQAEGTQEECFRVRVILPTGEDYTLPEFSFV